MLQSKTLRLALMVFVVVLGVHGVALGSTVSPTDWITVVGGWEAQWVNYDGTSVNTNAYAEVEQEGPRLIYEWTVRYDATTFRLGPAAGIHFLADSGTDDNRGNSYLVFQDSEFIRVYKAGSGRLTKMIDFPATVAVGETHTYRVEFNTESGELTVYRNMEEIGSWTDPSPLKSGKYISLRTNGTNAVFSNVLVTTD